MAVEYCRMFPTLRVVGIDVFPRALELARNLTDEAGVADRMELREQDVATLEDRNLFAVAWLPAPFVPRAALEAGVPRIAAALVPGGWLMVAHGKFQDDGLKNAINRLKTSAYGGTPLDDDEAQALLRDAGLELVWTVPTPEGVPALTVGRRPRPS
jgi:methylase of polypeptide subunit release factors